ncbi:MAG: hypothetical protein CENE_02568 [Candidatus Celerinatantimonas neptuna]|nr:MAG: hypothetical protein CENE_02568 [Candidatus Celerinatantimonas neptuna]
MANNKKWLLTLVPALFASQFAFAGSVSTMCSNGSLSVEMDVFSGETCNATQTIVINGDSTTTKFTITADKTNSFNLSSTDSASASVQLSCTSTSGSSSASASASTTDGCSGSN